MADDWRPSTMQATSASTTWRRDRCCSARSRPCPQESRRRLVRFHVSNGNRLVEAGDLLGSLRWFAEALRLDEDDPERAAIHQVRLESVLRHSPRSPRIREQCLTHPVSRNVRAPG